MARSSEYPNLTWVPARWWENSNRTSVQFIVIHTTEGSEHSQSAEDGASYDSRRDDTTSTHYFHDSNSTVQCILTSDVAYAAYYEGNHRGIQHELCAKAGDSVVQWNDAYHTAMLLQAAQQVALDCKKWNIPVRKITPSQMQQGVKGICGHVDVTNAFDGDHTDPGPNFPWTKFIGMVQDKMEDDEVTPADRTAIAKEVITEMAKATTEGSGNQLFSNLRAIGWKYPAQADKSALAVFNETNTLVKALATAVAAESTNPTELQAALAAIPTADENATAVVEALGGADVDDLADTLRTVLGPDKVAELKAAL